MRNLSLTFGLRESRTRTYPEPLVLTVLRDEFDQHLLHSAEAMGATILDGVQARGFQFLTNGRVVVQTEKGDFTGDCLVGADGANSVVSPLLNPRSNYFWQAAVYCEVPEQILKASPGNCDNMRIDWGTLPSGYAWAFPKNGSINIGAGGPISIARNLRNYASRFASETGIVGANIASTLKFTGHQLPTLTKNTRFARKNVVLVGDAAGLVEPFTGDGISFACHSAQIAAGCIASKLRSGSRDMAAYNDQIMSTIGAELLTCRRLLSLSVAFPRRIHELFKANDFVWQVFCRVLRGEESFSRLKKEVLGPLRVASKIIDILSARWEREALSSPALLSIAKG
jgi:flavin-dependent dehydrogenase